MNNMLWQFVEQNKYEENVNFALHIVEIISKCFDEYQENNFIKVDAYEILSILATDYFDISYLNRITLMNNFEYTDIVFYCPTLDEEFYTRLLYMDGGLLDYPYILYKNDFDMNRGKSYV